MQAAPQARDIKSNPTPLFMITPQSIDPIK